VSTPPEGESRSPSSTAGADIKESFVFDVSAREPAGVDDATGQRRRVHAAMAPPVERQLQAVARIIRDAIGQPQSNESPTAPAGAANDNVADANAVIPDLSKSAAGTRTTLVRTPFAEKKSTWRACYMSVVVHGSALLALGLMTVAMPQPLESLDVALAPDLPEEIEFSNPEPPIEAEGGDGIESLVGDAGGGPLELGEESLGGDSGELAMGNLAPDALAAGLLGEANDGTGDGSLDDVGLLFGAGSGGGQGGGRGRGHGGGGKGDGLGDGLGATPLAKFFGTKIEGHRIVFVLDNSGSMTGGRLETVIDELIRCIDSLTPDQEFYIVFYSDTIYPLFYPDPVDRYIAPTDRNKRLLAAWLDTGELCLGDAIVEALSAAAMIEPDTVFLLSDGRTQGERKMAFLLDARNRNFPIHTVGVGLGKGSFARQNLQQVALANAGEFRESDVPRPMLDLSRTHRRPYHSDAPGEIWGRQVKPGRWGR
jgi:hypothetical protein